MVSDVLACLGTVLRRSAWEPHGIGFGVMLCLASWHALKRFLVSRSLLKTCSWGPHGGAWNNHGSCSETQGAATGSTVLVTGVLACWAFVGAIVEQSWPILAQLVPSWGYLGTIFGPASGYLGLLAAILSHVGDILGPRALRMDLPVLPARYFN